MQNNSEDILEKLASILRNNGYKVYKYENVDDYGEDELPTVKSWVYQTDMTLRAKQALLYSYAGEFNQEPKTMAELIDDVRTGKITRFRGVGSATKSEIANAIRTSLKIDV